MDPLEEARRIVMEARLHIATMNQNLAVKEKILYSRVFEKLADDGFWKLVPWKHETYLNTFYFIPDLSPFSLSHNYWRVSLLDHFDLNPNRGGQHSNAVHGSSLFLSRMLATGCVRHVLSCQSGDAHLTADGLGITIRTPCETCSARLKVLLPTNQAISSADIVT